MEIFIKVFNLILYQPLFNLLIFLYSYCHDFGIAVILLTIIIRLILYPFLLQSIKSQKVLSELQPKILEVQKKYKNNRERQVKEMIALYQKEKINPLGSFLPFLIQLPILIALYQVFWKGLRPEEMANLYSFFPHPNQISPNFFGIINLAQYSLILAIIAGICQFFQTKMVSPKTKKIKEGTTQFSEILQKQMLYFFPILTVFILWRLPAALALYWIVSSLFSIFQQYLIYKKSYA